MMERIWAAVAPSRKETRVLVTRGPSETLLKARLSSKLNHPRALPSLLEALALWEGQKVHAVLAAVDTLPLFDSDPWVDFGGHHDTPLYGLDLALLPSRSRHRGIHGLGEFRDLHRLLVTEVAR